MSDDFGSDYLTIEDEEGQEFELEVLDSMEYNGDSYMAFLPADMDEDDPDYGIIILRTVHDETSGEELFESVDDDELLQDVYDKFYEQLYEDEDGEE